MFTLLRFLLRKELLIHAGSFCLALLWIGFCKILESSEGLNFARVIPLMAMGATFYFTMNISWIKSLPIKRSSLLYLNSLNFFINLAVTIATSWSIDTIIDHLFKAGEPKDSFESITPSINQIPFQIVIFISFAFITLVSFSFLIPGKITFGASASNWAVKTKFQQITLYIKIILGVLLLLIIFNGFINQHLILTVTMISIPSAVIAWSMNTIGMPRTLAKSWTIVFACIGLCGSLAVLFSAIYNTGSKDAQNRIAAVRHLGIFSGVPSSDFYRYALESDLPASKIQEVIYEFSKANHPFFSRPRSRWLKNNEHSISFERVISNKSTYDSIIATLDLFDPRSLSDKELEVFLDKLNSVYPRVFLVEANRSYWAASNLSDDFVIALLNSDKTANVNVAISYISFHPKKKFFDAFTNAIPNLPERALPQARNALEILTAQNVSLREISSFAKNNRKPEYREQVCDHFRLENLTNTHFANANICLRALSLKLNRNFDLAESLPNKKDDWGPYRISQIKAKFGN